MTKKIYINLKRLQDKMREHQNVLTDFDDTFVFNNVITNSCYDLKNRLLNRTSYNIPNLFNDTYIRKYKSLIVDINVNQYQHNILEILLIAYIQMYNTVIKFF